MSETKKRHLIESAYVSLLKHAERCDHDPDYDWADEPKDRRHAMNAALDLRDALSALAAKDEQIRVLKENVKHMASWTRAALDCSAWPWDADQREAAEQQYEEAIAALSSAPEGEKQP